MDDYLEVTAGLVDPQLRAEAEALLEQLQLLAEEKGVVEVYMLSAPFAADWVSGRTLLKLRWQREQ